MRNLTDKQLARNLFRAEKQAQAWYDKHGIIGRNHAQDKVNAYKWELYLRSL